MSIWSGEAPVPVVFLHGFATSTQMTWVEPGWFDLVKEGGRRPLGYDLLGHGDADTPDDIEAYKDLVTPVVEQLPFTPDEGRQIDIVGYSLGARTALDLTLRHPQLVRRLVLGGIGRNVVAGPA
ncbi:MAG: alpha/beta fold hydrolase, partial [Acidimicrobiia bacterium]|nr:alpha/beta fold hydrolase [Acidimicrobiia bacterium]